MLSRQQFERALRQGRGAARMHVIEHGLDGVEDLVLRACLENQAYDRQFEDQRASWFYPMFKDDPAYAQFSAAIENALIGESDDFSVEQVCELAALMALDGDAAAGRALRSFVWNQPESDSDYAGGHAIVALDGMAALVEIVRRLGRYLQNNPDDYVDSLDYLTEGGPLHGAALSALARLATDDAAIAAYVVMTKEGEPETCVTPLTDAEKLAKREQFMAQYFEEWPVARIIAAAGTADATRHSFSRFSRHARAEDVKSILARLHVETDVETCRRLLWSLSRATLPEMDARIWELANDGASGLRAEATIVLSSLCDPRVGELARQRLRDDFSAADDDVIGLFILNFEAGDEVLILSKLETLVPNDDDAHAFGTRIKKLLHKHPLPELAPLAEWVFRTNPCTICRNTAFESLQKTGRLPAQIAAEYVHDAYLLTNGPSNE